jgi:hypothetical protein
MGAWWLVAGPKNNAVHAKGCFKFQLSTCGGYFEQLKAMVMIL